MASNMVPLHQYIRNALDNIYRGLDPNAAYVEEVNFTLVLGGDGDQVVAIGDQYTNATNQVHFTVKLVR